MREALDKLSFFTIGFTVYILLEYKSELREGPASYVYNSEGYLLFVLDPTKEVIKF